MSAWAVLGLLAFTALVFMLFLLTRLRKSEERFRLLATNASDMIAIHSPDGRYLWVSPSVERLLGYKPRELVGTDPYKLFHPDDVPGIRAGSHDKARTGDSTARITYRIKRKDETYIWFETLTQPLMDKHGRVTQLQTASRDVTEQKKARDLYRFLIRHLPNTSVFLFGRDFSHLIADGTITGYTIPPSTSLEGLNIWQVFPTDIAKDLLPHYREVFSGNPHKVEKSFRTRTYRIHFLPVRGALGEVELGMAVFLDVTEEKATVAALQVRSEDLERSNRDLEQFANVASHELKSPLRRISSFAELMAEEYEGLLSEEADEYLGHIIEGVESLSSVIESLLAYSRVQTDRSRSNMTWIDANVVLKEALLNISALAKERGAVIQKGKLPDRIVADPTLLRQLFENLVGNAIKFNTTGRTPQVHIWAERDLVDWKFAVSDNGPGLDQADQDKAFTMFQRIHHEVDGTGIGLALCKKIIGIHRGRIWYDSEPGQGTAFWFVLPARSPEVSLPPFPVGDD